MKNQFTKNDLFLLLSHTSDIGIEIVPVPRNAAYRIEGEETGTRVSKEELVNFVLEKVSELSDEINLDISTNNNVIEGY